MPQTVLITGTGRPYALGFNLVKRYLEHGDTVFASIRRPSEALEELQRRLIPAGFSGPSSISSAAKEKLLKLPCMDPVRSAFQEPRVYIPLYCPPFSAAACTGYPLRPAIPSAS